MNIKTILFTTMALMALPGVSNASCITAMQNLAEEYNDLNQALDSGILAAILQAQEDYFYALTNARAVCESGFIIGD